MSQNPPRRRRTEPYFPFTRKNPSFDIDRLSRLGDLAIASMLLVLTLPLMLFVGLAIRYESPGPVLVRQTAVGRGGRRFDMLRFRTAEYEAHDERGPTRTQKATELGQFLRETRIEALPQPVNVRRGEMSILDRDFRSPSFLE
jgi:lipopolysaccharide/colanic/teichoic acid biosynthesis glycosyltransferase